jgi:hypothetical protein
MKTHKLAILGFLAMVWSFGTGSVVRAESHHVKWTFDHVGTQSYVLQSFEPAEAGLGTVGENNPILVLELGKRYDVTIIDYEDHPFEIISKADNASEDTVLLSMSGGGALESDTTIAWQNGGSGVVSFTLSQSLYEDMSGNGQIPGYRCSTHPSAMRGDFQLSLSPDNSACKLPCDDLACFSANFGMAGPDNPGDCDSDDDVDGGDLAVFAEKLGSIFFFEGGTGKLPFDGNRLITVTMGEGYAGSTTYFGSKNTDGEFAITGFTLDIGNGICHGSVDQEARPTHLNLPNGGELTFSYNEDGTFNFTLIEGDTLYSGANIIPSEGNSVDVGRFRAIAEHNLADQTDDENEFTPYTVYQAFIKGKSLLNELADVVCKKKITSHDYCFASSNLTEIVDEFRTLSSYATSKAVEFHQLNALLNEITAARDCDSGSTPTKSKPNDRICGIAESLEKLLDNIRWRYTAVIEVAIEKIADELVKENTTSYDYLCTCTSVAYSGIGNYEETFLSKIGNKGRKTCESDAYWFLKIEQDYFRTVTGGYLIFQKPDWLPNGDVKCKELTAPLVKYMDGGYNPLDNTFWASGGDFSVGDGSRFEGTYSLEKMTGSGEYAVSNEQFEKFGSHTNVIMTRAECIEDSDCPYDGQQCLLGRCVTD